MKANKAIDAMRIEVLTATAKFGSFNSCHEGYAVILEELNELWEEIKAKPRDFDKIRREAIQVGAMAIRFLMDLT